MSDPKSGLLTTEFYLTALPMVGVLVLLGLGRITVDDVASLWALFTGPGLYAVSRGLAKLRA